MKKAREIVVISGKGGTGKTTVAASLADIMPGKVIADCDVDAANLYILLEPGNIRGRDFTGKSAAVIDQDVCSHCNLCRELCRFDAIHEVDGSLTVDPLACDGCGLCEIACPVKAVEMKEQIVGKWFVSDTEFGKFVHARLIPGAENSGNLVTMVKHQAKLMAEEQGIDTILIDGPPGIGCPVIAAISGADAAVIVTEPTYSGISDLQRVTDLAAHFEVAGCIVINRFDINRENSDKIEAFAREKGIPVVARIPHSHCIMAEITASRLPARKCRELASQVDKIYEFLQKAGDAN